MWIGARGFIVQAFGFGVNLKLYIDIVSCWGTITQEECFYNHHGYMAYGMAEVLIGVRHVLELSNFKYP